MVSYPNRTVPGGLKFIIRDLTLMSAKNEALICLHSCPADLFLCFLHKCKWLSQYAASNLKHGRIPL